MVEYHGAISASDRQAGGKPETKRDKTVSFRFWRHGRSISNGLEHGSLENANSASTINALAGKNEVAT